MLNTNTNDPTLTFNGKTLSDADTLNNYGIKSEGILHIIDPSTAQSEITPIQPKSTSDNDTLADLLKKHNVYDELYQILHENNINAKTLENDLPYGEVAEFCKEFGINYKEKLKLRGLIRSISGTGSAATTLEGKQDCGEINDRSQIERYQAKKKVSERERKQSLFANDKMCVVLVGDMCAGKTCLMRKYCNDEFVSNRTSSIGIDNLITIQPLSKNNNNINMEIEIWDTAGQERYESICTAYYRKGDCIIICYDISVENPFKNFKHWREQINTYGMDGVPVIMVGCKTDLVNDEELLSRNRALIAGILEEEGWTDCCECSAKTGHNINGVFITAAELVLRTRTSTAQSGIHLDEMTNEKKRRCCSS